MLKAPARPIAAIVSTSANTTPNRGLGYAKSNTSDSAYRQFVMSQPWSDYVKAAILGGASFT